MIIVDIKLIKKKKNLNFKVGGCLLEVTIKFDSAVKQLNFAVKQLNFNVVSDINLIDKNEHLFSTPELASKRFLELNK